MAHSGIGVGMGAAAGTVARLAPPPELPDNEAPPADPATGVAQAETALAAVGRELDERADEAVGAASEVLLAQSMMVADPALVQRIRSALEEGTSVTRAIDDAFTSFADTMRAAGGYMAERAADLNDLRDRAVARVLGRAMPGIPDPGHPFVLVAGDLAPADTATLRADQVVAIVTELGGPTSHTAILAKSLGIPAVVSCQGAVKLDDGDHILVDSAAGEVTVDPDADTLHRIESAAARRAELLAASSGPGRTADGTSVSLLVNIGAQRDLADAAAADSEGVGLMRTEFLFLDRESAPGAEEQQRSYAAAFKAFAGRKVVVRTLDAGADKPLAFVEHGAEPNPALGVRGLRLAQRHPAVLEQQLAAIAAAHAEHEADVWVMAPMVSTPAEAADFAARAKAHGLPVVGAMVEVPATALRAGRVLAGCDFLSIGTNDLGQYTFAADRMAGELAGLLDPWQPALLDLIATSANAGTDAAKPVGVCGEAASDPLLALVLVGLGITSLSMAPTAVPEVRVSLAAHTLDECRALAKTALAAPDAAAAHAQVTAQASTRSQ